MIDWKRYTRYRWEVSLAGCIFVSLAVLALSETGQQRLTVGYEQGLRSMWLAGKLGELSALLVDAETGQRGYLLTGDDRYLQPYDDALGAVNDLQGQINDFYVQRNDPRALEQIKRVREQIAFKLSVLEQTTQLARQGHKGQAIDLFRTDIGKQAMDDVRQGLHQLQVAEQDFTAGLVADWRGNQVLTRVGIASITALNIVLLVLIVNRLKRDWLRARERERDLDLKVRERTSQLASLSSYLQEVSETEKTRLGRELHDELGAILTATRMDLLWVRSRLKPDQSMLLEKLQRALDHLDQGITVKRRIIEDLRPSILTNFGLMTAAREYAQQVADQSGWQLVLDLPQEDPELDDETEVALFRILQEALNNASKYAKATQVRIGMRCESGNPGNCILEVEDNGVGFRMSDVRHDAHGLIGMRQRLEPRGGSLSVLSVPGRRTLVRARMPVGPQLSAPHSA